MNGIQALKGGIRHAVCRWCYQDLSLAELCTAAKAMGLEGIDLVGPEDWPVLKEYGLVSSMCNGAELSLTEGFNHKEYHNALIARYKEMIPLVAKAGYRNLICFSGNRDGLDDETGLNNCREGLQVLLPLAEKHGVTLVMELLNARIDHPDYQCNSTRWGTALVEMCGSGNLKLLFDIYHMTVEGEDVIRMIRDYHPYIAHYHTAGYPGRNEVDGKQEIDYPAVMKAIVATGFRGFVAQEFVALEADKLESLRRAVAVCDV